MLRETMHDAASIQHDTPDCPLGKKHNIKNSNFRTYKVSGVLRSRPDIINPNLSSLQEIASDKRSDGSVVGGNSYITSLTGNQPSDETGSPPKFVATKGIGLSTQLQPLPSEIPAVLKGEDARERPDGMDLAGAVHLNSSQENNSSTEIAQTKLALPLMDPKWQRSGGFAMIYTASYNNRMVAVKVAKVETKDDAKTITRRMTREIKIGKLVEHRNVIPMLGSGFCEFSPFEVIIMPWYENGSAYDYLKGRVSFEDRVRLCHDVTCGLEYLHGLNPIITHGDVTPHNILVNKQGVAALCDLGLARQILEKGHTGLTTSTAHSPSPSYAAPEILLPDKSNVVPFEPKPESDCYSLASVIYKFLTLKEPYGGGCHRNHVIVEVYQGTPPAKRPGDGNLDPRWWDIFEACWTREPEIRPSASEVKASIEAIDENVGQRSNREAKLEEVPQKQSLP